jgi:virginiamycin B lyase
MKCTSFLAAAVTVCATFSQHAGAQQAATITEFPTPSTFSYPQGIDTSASGDIWYAETSAGKIAELRPDLTTAEFPVPNGGEPFIVKVGSGGIWFTYANKAAVGYLNPSTGAFQEYAIPSGASPVFIQLAPDGSKWFSETAGIGRLAPNGSITEWSFAQEHPDDNIEQLSIDPFGNIWSAERNFDGLGAAGTNKVRRLNPATNVVSTYLVPTFGGNPAGVQTNPDGTVWVSEYFANAFALLIPALAPHTDALVAPSSHSATTSSAVTQRINPSPASGTKTKESAAINSVLPSFTLGWIEYQIPTPNAMAEDMRIDHLGRVWYEGDTGYLGVLNPYTATFTQYAVPSINSGYYNIVLDPKQDRLWFTEAGVFAPVATKIGYLPTGNW